MKRFLKLFMSLNMFMIALATPITANANVSRDIPGPVDGWPDASVSRTFWSITSANGQSVSFTVAARSSSASATVLNIELTNSKIFDKYGKVVCDKVGTKGSCPTIYANGAVNRYTVKAGTNGKYASYVVESAFYY